MYDELAARDAACLSCDIIPADYEPSSPYSTGTFIFRLRFYPKDAYIHLKIY
jgi:hypothetical protein